MPLKTRLATFAGCAALAMTVAGAALADSTNVYLVFQVGNYSKERTTFQFYNHDPGKHSFAHIDGHGDTTFTVEPGRTVTQLLHVYADVLDSPGTLSIYPKGPDGKLKVGGISLQVVCQTGVENTPDDIEDVDVGHAGEGGTGANLNNLGCDVGASQSPDDVTWGLEGIKNDYSGDTRFGVVYYDAYSSNPQAITDGMFIPMLSSAPDINGPGLYVPVQFNYDFD